MIARAKVRELIKFYTALVESLGPEDAAEIAHLAFRGHKAAHIFALLCKEGELSATWLMKRGIPEPTAYRVLKILRRLGLIKMAFKSQVLGKSGPKATVWKLERK